MTGDSVQAAKPETEAVAESADFVTCSIAGQLFGLPVLRVQDVLAGCQTSPIPLAPPEILGQLNLRGRVVTAIDLRRRLGLKPRDAGGRQMSIVIEHEGELYSLVVDGVGEVLSLEAADHEPSPPTLDPQFRRYSAGIYRLAEGLLVVLDVSRLLDYSGAQAA